MIKFRTDCLVGLGLTERNLSALREGLPILFDGAEVGLPQLTFLILYGKTEKAIFDELQARGAPVPPAEFDAEGNPSRAQHFEHGKEVGQS